MTRGLALEIGKAGPFDLPEQEAFLNLLRTTSVLGNQTERFFRKAGLSMATYNVLRILRGSEPSGKTCTQVGVDMVAQVPDVTRLIDRLEKAGLVSRSRENADRRIVRVRITAKGLELLGRMDRPVLDLHRAQLGHMGVQALGNLSELLCRARHAPGDLL